ncbi:MAG: AGE family epimerase/isomerase, partial [Clostridia bacterium]|nr:AGE family epimerase/isomerase [Clostridia bacterium]
SITGDEKYFKLFERVHAYAFGHFADHECGEWYGYLHKDGTVSHTQKGSMWKGPFHYPRMLMNMEYIFGKLEAGEQVDSLL